MSTVHCIHRSEEDVIKRKQRRLKLTSTNAKIVRAVFGENTTKMLFILLVIDDYNHHMNGIDIANQRCKGCFSQRKQNIKHWRLLFHWLLDIVMTNCFILWRMQAQKKDFKVS